MLAYGLDHRQVQEERLIIVVVTHFGYLASLQLSELRLYGGVCLAIQTCQHGDHTREIFRITAVTTMLNDVSERLCGKSSGLRIPGASGWPQ